MKDLIEALTIFAKYTLTANPTGCDHDTLWVDVDPSKVSEEDRARLEELSFHANVRDSNFRSYRFGSC